MTTTTYKRTSATTRRVTNELREIAHHLNMRNMYYARVLDNPELVLWDAAVRRAAYDSYSLEGSSEKVWTSPIVIHADSGGAWIRPASRADVGTHVSDIALAELAAETRYLDVLFDVLEAGGWHLEPGSETRESLEAWRNRRWGR